LRVCETVLMLTPAAFATSRFVAIGPPFRLPRVWHETGSLAPNSSTRSELHDERPRETGSQRRMDAQARPFGGCH
jgi:hypothetical protein